MQYLCVALALQQQQVRTVVRWVNGVLCAVVVAALRLLPLRLLSFSLAARPRRTEGLCLGPRPAVPFTESRQTVNVTLFGACLWPFQQQRWDMIEVLITLMVTGALFGLRVRVQEVHLAFAPPQFMAAPQGPLQEGGGYSGAALLKLPSLCIDTW